MQRPVQLKMDLVHHSVKTRRIEAMKRPLREKIYCITLHLTLKSRGHGQTSLADLNTKLNNLTQKNPFKYCLHHSENIIHKAISIKNFGMQIG
jgi:hypothetical protein